MARDAQLFSFLWSKDEECFYANIFYTYLFVAYIIHHTGGSLIRYNLFGSVKELRESLCVSVGHKVL